MKNIFAFTENNISCPSYVSLNEDNEQAYLIVRSSGAQTSSMCNLSDEELKKLADSIINYLSQKEQL